MEMHDVTVTLVDENNETSHDAQIVNDPSSFFYAP